MRDRVTRMKLLRLEEFVPFRLNRLADAVSLNLSDIYRDRFGLAIGQFQERTAQQISLSTRMHKSRVSRAVASMEDRKLVERTSNAEDGREMRLCLTKAGERMYAALVPLALERERELLSCLSDSERRIFLTAITQLEGSLELSEAT
jgi:DNA-binding MarR family transcriptional regulator